MGLQGCELELGGYCRQHWYLATRPKPLQLAADFLLDCALAVHLGTASEESGVAVGVVGAGVGGEVGAEVCVKRSLLDGSMAGGG